MTRLVSLLAESSLFALACACGDEPENPTRAPGDEERTTDVQPTAPEPAPAEQTGKLVVHFTIDGDKDPDACTNAHLREVEVTLTMADQAASSGVPGGAWRHACEAFAMSVTVRPAVYVGSAVLLDGSNVVRTSVVPLGTVTIHPNEVVSTTIDFPSSSFVKRP